jgi:hypothetical protein
MAGKGRWERGKLPWRIDRWCSWRVAFQSLLCLATSRCVCITYPCVTWPLGAVRNQEGYLFTIQLQSSHVFLVSQHVTRRCG